MGRQQALWAAAPLAYIWDDHDFGVNNADATGAGVDAAAALYRSRVPLARGDTAILHCH